MAENRFLIDEEAPQLPRNEKIGLRFQLRWRQNGKVAYVSLWLSCLCVLSALLILYGTNVLREYPSESALIMALLVLGLWLLREQKWLGVFSKKLFGLYDWCLIKFFQRSDGEQLENQTYSRSTLLRNIVVSSWLLGGGLGGGLLVLMGFAFGAISSSVAWIIASSVVGAALSKSAIEAWRDPAIVTEGVDELTSTSNEPKGDKYDNTAEVSEESQGNDVEDEILDDCDVAAPFVSHDEADTEKSSTEQDHLNLEAAIEGIEPSFLESANQDLLSQMVLNTPTVVLPQRDISDPLDVQDVVSDSIEDAILHI